MFRTSSQLTSLKNGWRLISSASPFPDPSRRLGSRVRSYLKVNGVSIPITHSAPHRRRICTASREHAYLLQYGDRVLRHRNRIKRLILQNSIENFIFIVAPERRLPKQHLVHQHTERPPVNRAAVTLFQNDLRIYMRQSIGAARTKIDAH